MPPTAKEKGEKKLFGFSFVPLMQEDGRTLPDGTHELIVHKVTSGTDVCVMAVRSGTEPRTQRLVITLGTGGRWQGSLRLWKVAGRESVFVTVLFLDSVL